VVACAHAVIDEGAVVVEPLHALVADRAVARAISADGLAIRAQHDRVELFQ